MEEKALGMRMGTLEGQSILGEWKTNTEKGRETLKREDEAWEGERNPGEGKGTMESGRGGL